MEMARRKNPSEEYTLFYESERESSYDDFVDMYEIDPDSIDPWRLAREVGIGITRGKEFYAGHLYKGGLVSALFIDTQVCFSFDVVVDPAHQAKGLGAELVDVAIGEFDTAENYFDWDDEYAPESYEYCVEVVNPHMKRLLERKGFYVHETSTDGNSWLMRRARQNPQNLPITYEDIEHKLQPPLDCAEEGDLRGRAFHNRLIVNYEGVDFSGCVLYHCFPSGFEGAIDVNPAKSEKDLTLEDVDFRGAKLRDAALQGVNLEGADLKDASFYGANLKGAKLESANLQNANLQSANLRGANLQDANLQDVNLWIANLQGANLQGANLRGVDLVDVKLQGANLRGVDLEDVKLQGANLQDACLIETDLRGMRLGGTDLRGTDLRGVNLQGVDLGRAKLQDATLKAANLEGADLLYANLEGADLYGANLKGAKLESANLQNANLQSANLRGANLQFAALLGANLQSANLQDADLDYADLMGDSLLWQEKNHKNATYNKHTDFDGSNITEDQLDLMVYVEDEDDDDS
jgi:uncharacterized protein YjbI with pentapeptide repeats/GNAT superfamily N-acetyltransferase